MRKKRTLMLSVPQRLEGLAVVVLAIAALVFLGMSARTLYQFPVPDSYRWYGDETWLMLAWKNLIAHGRMVVPIALESTLQQSPGLLLGSSWFTALWYGVPQLLFPPHFDPVTIGRTVSFCFGLAMLFIIGRAGYRLKLSASITTLSIVLLVATPAFTLASHSARYDMITGVAVLGFIEFFAVRIGDRFLDRPRRGTRFAAWLGFAALLICLTISPHVGALVLLPTLFLAWYFGAFRTIGNAISFVAGAAVAFAALSAIYILANHHLALAGIAAGDNQERAYLQHVPILRLFSWSAERHQLGAKLYYLWHEAPAFTIVLPFIALSEIILLFRKRQHAATLFLTICLGCVLLSGALLQSTLPYYVSYFLPLAALVFAAHAREWANGVWLRPAIAIVSLVMAVEIFAFWLPELSHAGKMGKRIDDANTAAVQAAIEQASLKWEPGTDHPLILAQAPAIHELLRDTNVRVMSEAFLFFPLHPFPLHRPNALPIQSPDSVIARADVNYILDYNKPMTPEYELAVHKWKPIFSRAGPLLDRTLNYFHDTASELDTMTMYQVDSLQ
ncbi:MAG TPA: hypothetical protein VFH95_09500 [Candidatus Kapabacteria bacterium]|nr:hypothetical protein [Candidatus Kapabacteria bacterium]